MRAPILLVVSLVAAIGAQALELYPYEVIRVEKRTPPVRPSSTRPGTA